MADDDKKRTKKENDALLEEIRERYDVAMNFWRPIRDQRATDMRFVSGDPWDDKDKNLRIQAGRPFLSLDELGQYENQVINDIRANPRAVKFSPTGSGANDQAARFYQDKMREIEYRSNAQIAYTTAFQNCLEGSYGWVRVNTKYEEKGFNQELWIEDIPNPDMVLPDPEAKRPDSSDMKYLFHFEQWTQKEFKRAYPDAEITDFGDLQQTAPSWIKDETIIVAEYWRITTKKRELLMITPPPGVQAQPAVMFADEIAKMPDQGLVSARRTVDWPKVTQFLTNGVEILEESDWPGKSIPFASCYGKRIYVDTGSGPRLTVLSMTRLARDPIMLYNYYRTAQAELVGLSPKTPFVGYVGQFRTRADDWQKVHAQPLAFIEADAMTEETGQQILPLPSRQPYDPPIERLEIGAESARRAIQAAMGTTFLPTQAQRRNEKSGKALQQIEQTAQKGAYHFVDSYDHMIRRVGELCEDLITPIYDTARDVGIVKVPDKAANVRINDPNDPNSISTKGDYQVTISTGPSFESEREAASDFTDLLVQNIQMVAGVSGPPIAAAILGKSVKLKNLGPIGDQIADLITPPQFQEQQGQQDPEQMQKQLAMAISEVQKLQQVAQQQAQIIETEQVKAQRDVALEQAKQENENHRAAAENATKLQLEKMKIVADLLKVRATLEAKQTESMIDAGVAQLDREVAIAGEREEREAVSQEAEKDRQFQGNESERDRAMAREEHAQNRAQEATQNELGRKSEAEAREAQP